MNEDYEMDLTKKDVMRAVRQDIECVAFSYRWGGAAGDAAGWGQKRGRILLEVCCLPLA